MTATSGDEEEDEDVLTGTLDVKVTVKDVDEAPTAITGPKSPLYGPIGSKLVATFGSSDPEGATVTWSLPAGADKGKFEISTAGALTFKSQPSRTTAGDANGDFVYNVTVRASDGAKHRQQAVTVRINKPPIITGTFLAVGVTTKPIPENSTQDIGTVSANDPDGDNSAITWALTGTDGVQVRVSEVYHFGGDSFASITFVEVAEYELASDSPYWDSDKDHVYVFNAQAFDAFGPTTSVDLRVKVTDEDEAPKLSGFATVTVDEGSTAVGTYTAVDPEGESILWALAGDDRGDFNISSGGALSFKTAPSHSSPADQDMDNVYKVTIRAKDATGTEAKAADLSVEVTVQSASIFRFTGGRATYNYPENRTAAVATYTAADPSSQTISYSLEGTDAGDFSIDSSSGEVTFASTPNYESPADSDTDNEYEFTVKATAGTDAITKAVTVTVANVDEPITVTGPATVSKPGGGARKVAGYTGSDPEGQVFWSVTGTDATAFVIDATSEPFVGELKFKATPDFDNPADADADNVYEVTVVARDQLSFARNTDSLAVSVTVTADQTANVSPVISGGGATHNYAENGTAAVATYTATDADGDTITWSLEGTDAADFSISTSGVLTFASAPDFETPADSGTDNIYNVTVKASDGTDSDTIAVTVTVTAVDEPPAFTAGAISTTYAENGTTAVSTYTATDPEGTAVTYSLEGADSGAFSISTSGALTFDSAPDYETKASYAVTVKATAGSKSATRNVTITISNVNEAPSISGGGATHSHAENDTSTISTYSATDPDAGTTITWTVEGTDGGDFAISNSGVLTFDSTPDREDPDDDNTDNVYEITVKASDGTLSDTLDVEITVTNVNEVPTLSGVTSVTKVEDVGKVVTTYTAADPEGQTIVWSLSGDDAADFTIPAGVLTFKVVPDADNPHDADTDNVYKVTVKAADGTATTALSATIDVEVTVSATNDTPTITGGGASHSYAEEGVDAIATYTATDDEGDTIVWTVSGADASKFEITTGGVLSFEDPPDYEDPGDTGTDNVYNVTVEASDGNTADTLAVTVTVTAVDEPPDVAGSATITKIEDVDTAVATYTATDPEAVTTITWSLTGTDAGAFDLSTAGVLTFQQVPDFDDPDDADGDNRYEITINAADGTDATAKTGTLDVVVTVSDTNESPVIGGLASYNYDEDRTDAVATFTATDPEGDTIGWSLSGDDASAFDIDEGALTFLSQPDYENHADSDTDGDYEITVEASDGTNTPTLAVTVTVDNVNEAPTITTEPIPSELEYTAGLTIAVYTFEATDPDANTTLRWTLEGTDRGDFDISSDGVLTFKKSPDFDAPADADRDNIYEITIKAADGTGSTALSDTFDAQVEVKPDPLSGGLEVGGERDVTYAENEETDVGNYTVTHEHLEADAVIEWTLEGPDAALFAITPDSSTHGANLSFESPPDFEARADRNRDGAYEVTIKVSSGTGKGSRSITVTVTDVDEVPVVEGPETLEVEENTTTVLTTYKAVDPEGADTTITLSVTGDGADFTLTDAGELRFTPPADFDSPSDLDDDNVYEITIQGSDETLSEQFEVEVTVTDVKRSAVLHRRERRLQLRGKRHDRRGVVRGPRRRWRHDHALPGRGRHRQIQPRGQRGSELRLLARLRVARGRQPGRSLRVHGGGVGRDEHDPPERHGRGREHQRSSGGRRPRYGHGRRKLDRRGHLRHQRPGRHARQGDSHRSRRESVRTLGRRDQLHHSAQLRVARRRRQRRHVQP